MDALKKRLKEEIESIGYYLYDVHIVTRDGQKVLSVEIENDTYIDIDDCVVVSDHINPVLDELDPIKDPYSLEVTSSGAERTLRNFEEISRAQGKFVHVETFEQTIEGTLEALTETQIQIKDKRKRTSTILIADIQTIRLAINF